MFDLTVFVEILRTSLANQFLSGGLGLMFVGSVGYLLRNLPRRTWNTFIYYGTVVVDVYSDDQAYGWLLNWLNTQEYTRRRARRLSIKHVPDKRGVLRENLVPAYGTHWFMYNRRPLWLSRRKEAGESGLKDLEALLGREQLSIRVIGRNQKVVTNLIAEARKVFYKEDENSLLVCRYQWGAWSQNRRLKRCLDSIVFPPQGCSLLLDMSTFISSQDWYRHMGIPYRRGYLFYGPPGTGKSCTVEALAGALNLPLFILNLAGISSDQGLEQAVGSMQHNGTAILLIEDVDLAAVNRDADKPKFSLGTLLNVIDGLLANDNVILVLTTNHPEVLDEALIRPGRIDVRCEFGNATDEQIQRMVNRLLPTCTPEQEREITQWPRPISLADVQERLKRMILKNT